MGVKNQTADGGDCFAPMRSKLSFVISTLPTTAAQFQKRSKRSAKRIVVFAPKSKPTSRMTAPRDGPHVVQLALT